ncbi:MAG: hypothetical protein KKA07_17160 [Bacteroidetes bacterium]|nr:hypothetical protein [Bacteroidota bacterium]MBU1720798.1 hypothetical protein [Bacteroidota bacterium]
MKTLLSIFASLFLLINARAQDWEWQNPIPHGTILRENFLFLFKTSLTRL